MPAEADAGRWRRRLAAAALVLGCLALFVANIAVFLRLFVFDTDTFADAVAPEDPDEQVIDALAETISTRLVDNADVQQRIDDLTPRDNPLVAAAIANGASGVIDTVVRDVLASSAFRRAWRSAVETAHDQFVNLVERDDNQPVTLNLTSTVQQVRQRLQGMGIDIIGDSTMHEVGDVVAVRRGQIDDVRESLDLLRTLSIVMVIAALLLLAAALALAVDERAVLLRIGLGVMTLMLVTGVAMRITRRIVLSRFNDETRRDAVASLWERVFAQLSWQTIVVFVFGAVLAACAWLVGPSASATGLRQKVRSMTHRGSASPQQAAGTA